MKKLTLFILMLTTGPAFSAAGKALFVSGTVSAEGAKPRAIVAGAEVDVGDTIVTASRSRAQLAMNDGQRYALRAGTRFRIDAFSLPPAVRGGAQATAVAADGQSFFTLQRGGFRAVSGAIGKKDTAAYEVRTPVGTLGIRGTVWAAVFCRDDCDDAPGLAPGQPIRNGLYLGVDQGRIHFAGRGLELELNAGEFAFIPLDEVPIERLREPPALLRGDGAGPLEIAGSGPRAPAYAIAKPANFVDRRSPPPLRDPAQIDPQPAIGDQVNQDISGQGPRGAVVKLTAGSTPALRSIAYDYGGGQAPLVNAGSTLTSLMVLDAQGNLLGFTTPNGALQGYAIGSASQANLGSSAETGIRWGRWSAGNATVTAPGAAAQTLNLSQQSLPWMLGPQSAAAIAVPISGARTYLLVGGTNPTDTLGNVGVLGAAFLAADFTNRNVTATLALDIANRNWWASGTAPIVAGSNQFGGNFSDVRLGGVTGNTGSLAGFLTEAQSGGATAAGAAFGYWLVDATGQQGTVTGVVALREGQGAAPLPPPPPNRYVSFIVGNFTPAARGGPFGGTQSNAVTQYLLNGGGNPTRFSAPDLSGASVTYDLNSSAVANAGFDAGTGLRWGRWAGGSARIAGAQPLDLGAQSLHWVLGPSYPGSPTLPQAGSGYLTVVGGTAPTDTRGNVGVLGGASLFVDFTNLNLRFALVASVDGRNWYASGQTRLTANSLQFSDVLAAGNVGNLAAVSGVYRGFIVIPAAGGPANLGAGVNWSLDSLVGSVGAVSGAEVFSAAGSGYPNGGGNALPAPLLQRRDIAFSSADVRSVAAMSNAASDYTLGGFDMTSLRGQFNGGQAPVTGQFDIGNATNLDQGFDLRGMLRWGRWAGGTGTLTSPPGSGNPLALDLASHSLHWITSADSTSAPALPVAGTASYTWVGATSPTNQANEAGVLTAATFDADFTNATVAASIQASFSNALWVGAGGGSIGGGTNLFNGILAGKYTDTASGLSLPAAGSYNGFFTGPQDAAGVPNGVGLSFEMSEAQSQTSVNGVAAFVARP